MVGKSVLAKSAACIGAVWLIGSGLSACAPTTAYNGFQAVEDKPEDIKAGVDTKSTVLTRLGSPSAQATFDPNIWFYVTQVTDKVAYKNPRVRVRTVVAVTFDKDEKVKTVNTYGLTNGYQIAINKRQTPTRGRELTALEQILGNIGRGSMQQPEDVPGQRPIGQ